MRRWDDVSHVGLPKKERQREERNREKSTLRTDQGFLEKGEGTLRRGSFTNFGEASFSSGTEGEISPSRDESEGEGAGESSKSRFGEG